MKTKLISGVLAMLILLSLAGCGGNGNDISSGSNSNNPPISSDGNQHPSSTEPSQTGSNYKKESLLAMPEDDASQYVTEDVDGGIKLLKYVGNVGVAIIPSEINGKAVVVVGYRAFAFNESIEAILLPQNVKLIESEAFSGCSKLQVAFSKGENLKEIEESAFSSCGLLVKVELPSSVEKINGFAFQNSSKVTIITPKGSYAETFAKDKGITVGNE